MSRSLARCTACLVALVVAVALAGCGGGGGGSSSLGAGVVADVNGEQVTQAQLDEVIAQAQARLEAQGQKIPAAGSEQYQAFQQNALQYLVEKIEYAQQAKELGVSVTPKQVDERKKRVLTQFFGGSEKKYEESLKKQKLTDEQVRDELRSTLLAEGLFKKVSASAKVSETQVVAYYNAHPELYQAKSTRSVAHILVKTKALADRVYSQLQNGADFATLAKKYSIDSSKNVGGKLTIREGETVPPFEKAAFALKTGAISKPVKSQFGWHVITALGPLQKGKSTPLDAAKASIRQTLESSAQSQAVSAWLDDLKKKYADKITYANGFAPPSTEVAPSTTPTG
jgi:parvulin-like peptidyl-prolyl isomerase